MNKTELVEALAVRIGDRRAAATAVDGLLATIVDTVQSGDSVSITGFGVFEARARASRVARNPRTGEAVDVPATTVPAFRPGAGFRAAVGVGSRPAPRATPSRRTAAAAPAAKAGAKASTAKASSAKTSSAKTSTEKASTAKTGKAASTSATKPAAAKTASSKAASTRTATTKSAESAPATAGGKKAAATTAASPAKAKKAKK